MKIVLHFGGIKISVSRDLLKIFGFYKMFWIANNVCDTVNKKLFIFLLWLLLRFKNFGDTLKKIATDKST